jgi:manganese/iron transport system permease protein
VLRKLTFFGHALSHTVFPGIVLATVLQVYPLFGALVAAALTVALVSFLMRRSDVGDDSAVGIVFIGLFAFGVMLVGIFRIRSATIGDALVGNVLGIGTADLVTTAVLVVLAVGTLVGTYHAQVMTAFNRTGALALGLPVAMLDALLLGLVATTAIVAVQVVGVIMTVAMLVTPAVIVRPWVDTVPRMMILSAGVSGIAGVIGLYVAFYLPIAPSALIVCTLTFGVFLSVTFQRLRARHRTPKSLSAAPLANTT